MPETRRPRVGILISGRGSNMVALVNAMRDGRVPAEPVVVISNVPGAAGLPAAAGWGIATAVIDHTADLHKIRCPTMVVAPGADPIHLIDEYQLLRREIKQCEFIVYEGLPHNITDTVPDRCAQELLRFLKSVA